MMSNIPFFDYASLYPAHKDEYSEAIENVLSRGAFIMQSELFEFEDKLSNYLDVKHAIGVADGTTALLLSLRASEIQAYDEVIVPSHTFAACASTITQIGAVPILCDCCEDHLIDPESVEKLINGKTKAIMPVHLNGRTANMDKILELAHSKKLLIIEDACQALGSSFKNTFAGKFGLAGAFSFYPSKTLGCFGDGGAIITNDDEIARKIKLFRDHGRNEEGDIEVWGNNARLDNLQAAVLLIRLKYYDEEIMHRRLLANRYEERLGNIEALKLPPAPDSSKDHYDIFQNYEIEAKNRDALKKFLSEKKVGTILPWGGYCLHNFNKLNLTGHYDYTEKMRKELLLLPLNSSIAIEEIDLVCDYVECFYNL